MACDAQTLINTAYANGYARMSERDLKEATLASACAGSGGSGGGVGGGAGAPVADPGTSFAIYIDENNGTLYEWYAGAWH